MVFSSVLFLIYFLPITLAAYYLAPDKYKNPVLVIASVFFYAYCAPVFIFLVIATIAVDFFIAKHIDKNRNNWRKKVYLALSVVVNIAILGYFKYADFLIQTLNQILNLTGEAKIAELKLLLPVGISFFTFQKITYVIDVYRGDSQPQTRFSGLLLYILLFPQLIAGPIVRYQEIESQLFHRRLLINRRNIVEGFFLFVVGLAKKVLIANVLAKPVDLFFKNDVSLYSFETVLFIMICYCMQIYFDFAGYSDMAIGIGKMLGFRFPENFNFPYTSASITEFWRRWHMTLGRFMKDYLYIPLGGNRLGKWRTLFNLWLVFILSGLWHGASWVFILWGAWHGFFLVVERIFSLPEQWAKNLPFKLIRVIFTFMIVLIGWIFFRAESFTVARIMIEKIISLDGNGTSLWLAQQSLAIDQATFAILALAAIFAFGGISTRLTTFLENFLKIKEGSSRLQVAAIWMVILFLWFQSLGEILGSGYNPFIYFRF